MLEGHRLGAVWNRDARDILAVAGTLNISQASRRLRIANPR
jgi:hypothetical protein